MAHLCRSGCWGPDILFNGSFLGDPTAKWLTDLQWFAPTEKAITPLLPLRQG